MQYHAQIIPAYFTLKLLSKHTGKALSSRLWNHVTW